MAVGIGPATEWDDIDTEPMFPAPPKEPKAPQKVEDRFPHRCPKCQRRCYLGLNRIEHEIEGYCQ